jgi:hypothetical protein
MATRRPDSLKQCGTFVDLDRSCIHHQLEHIVRSSTGWSDANLSKQSLVVLVANKEIHQFAMLDHDRTFMDQLAAACFGLVIATPGLARFSSA